MMDEIINKKFGGAPVFARSSTRSPKDSAIKTPKFRQELIRNLKSEQNMTLAVVKTLGQCLQCSSGSEAFLQLTCSERIYADFTRVLLFLDEKLKKQGDHVLKEEQIIVRKFDLENIPQLEFRCFVKSNKITAITQYFSTCFDPYIGQNKDNIWKAIESRVEQVSSLLNTNKDFTVDFAYRKDGEVKVVELNPYSTQTSAGLFSWRNETDKKILTGESPCEFRILEKQQSKEDELKGLNEDIRNMIIEIEKDKNNCLLM